MPARELPGHIGHCDTHDKLLYSDRRRAKAAIRSMGEKRMRAYHCDEHDGLFHVGHLPLAVVAGLKTVREVYQTREATS